MYTKVNPKHVLFYKKSFLSLSIQTQLSWLNLIYIQSYFYKRHIEENVFFLIIQSHNVMVWRPSQQLKLEFCRLFSSRFRYLSPHFASPTLPCTSLPPHDLTFSVIFHIFCPISGFCLRNEVADAETEPNKLLKFIIKEIGK